MNAYAGKILRVDLSRQRIREEPIDPALARAFDFLTWSNGLRREFPDQVAVSYAHSDNLFVWTVGRT